MPPISKPEPLKRQKARTQRQHWTARVACVTEVWKRADHCCEQCGRWVVKPAALPPPSEMGHVHEIVYRSRGGSDTDPKNCLLLCAACHAKVHAKRVTL